MSKKSKNKRTTIVLPTQPRIIAEIPNSSKEYCKIRKRFLNDIHEIYDVNVTSKHEFKSSGDVPTITIVGYPFFDTAHWKKKQITNKQGYKHGSINVKTLWEIHPTVKIEVE